MNRFAGTIACVMFCSLSAVGVMTPAVVWAQDADAPAAEDAKAQDKNESRQRRANSGAWDHDLLLCESTDGVKFTKPAVIVERAGMPSITRDSSGRLLAAFQWYPMNSESQSDFDQIAVITSNDNGRTWTKPQRIHIENMPADYIRPSDPALVSLDDGRVRLYFTSYEPGMRNSATYSAVSSDGLRFTFEPGVRFKVEGRQVNDPAVARLGDTWHYFAPLSRGPAKAYHAVSRDGLTFESKGEISIDGAERRWVGCAAADGDRLRFFGTGPGGVWTATSTDGQTWVLDEQPVSTSKTTSTKKPKASASQIKTRGSDPAMIRTSDGKWLMMATGPVREDAGKISPPENRPLAKPAAKSKAEKTAKKDQAESPKAN